jgi:hypothetical protein
VDVLLAELQKCYDDLTPQSLVALMQFLMRDLHKVTTTARV